MYKNKIKTGKEEKDINLLYEQFYLIKSKAKDKLN